jgi:ABC-2 type transport system permease protein
MEEYLQDNPEVANFFPGGATDIVNSYLAFTIVFSALITAAYGVTSAMRARGEETSGRAEPVLATATSRWAWLGSHLSVALVGTALVLLAAGFGEGLAYGLAISDLGQVPRMMAVALVYLPAVWAVVAVAVLGFGWLPRVAAAVAWVVFGFCVVVTIFSDVFALPVWVQNASPFAYTPLAPFEAVAAAPLLVIAGVAIAFLAAGLVGFRRRDVGY